MQLSQQNWNTLRTRGYITLEVFSNEERAKLKNELKSVTQKFQEYKKLMEDGLVMGGFGAFGNPSSFHNPWVRKIRKQLHPVILNNVFATPLSNDPDLKFEQDIDRLMIRTPYQKVGSESWHRDESKYAKKGDTIFGGWVNFDEFNHYLSACPGTHLEEDVLLENKGFARIEKKDYPKYEALKEKIPVPPGHILIFYERMVHEVRPSKGQTIHRLFMGWRTTKDTQCLLKGGNDQLDKLIKTMAVVPIKSGQKPKMYSGSHWNFHRKKIEDWSERINDVCTHTRVVSSGKEKGKEYKVVHQMMKSMEYYGFLKYKPYTQDEISILKPHRPSIKRQREYDSEPEISNLKRMKYQPESPDCGNIW